MANILFALSFSVFTIFRTAFYWLWYLRLAFESVSLIILTLTLIRIVKLQLYHQQHDFENSEYALTQSQNSASMIIEGEKEISETVTLLLNDQRLDRSKSLTLV